MALPNEDYLAIINSPKMQARIRAKVIQYAIYIQGNNAATEGQKSWSRSAVASADSIANIVGKNLLPNSDFLADGSNISQGSLDSVIETAINDLLVTEPDE